MQYRKFGKLNWQLSALGFGCMRFPLLDSDSSHIDEVQSSEMLEYAIESGVNYLDTAYPYHGGQSEIFLGKFLKNGYRDKVKLATKLPTWLTEEKSDFDKYLNEQLEKLQTDHIDFYLLHGLNGARWPKLLALDVFEWSEKAIADGRIGHLGFSFHDDYEAFKMIVDSYDQWTFTQIQYNYMDIENQAGTRGLRYAASKGLAVVVMEPILGGQIVDPPEAIKTIWEKAETPRKPADWALQWLWDQPEISVVLSGMSNLTQVKENVASAKQSGISKLKIDDLKLVSEVREKYNQLSPIPCTKCEYCLPCPSGVNIPRNFEIFNQGKMYDKMDQAQIAYNKWLPTEENASNCQDCKDCESLCPQQILISEWMPKIHAVLVE
jgi:predicted aldo/keto reductase-like oxidoreductase